MSGVWKLKRTHQCEKCPWRVEADPFDIPNGYDVELHQGLSRTIAEPGSIRSSGHVFACHEHAADEEVHCVGWLMNQFGPGNNIPLRIRMIGCENARAIRLRGEQHETFEATLPALDRKGSDHGR